MSELSEALERQLRKLMPQKAPLPTAPKVAAKAKSIKLAYQEGSSDKVYHVQIIQVNNGAVYNCYEVHYQYGRRGKTLQRGLKTSHPITWEEAEQIYYKLVQEKCDKGYREVWYNAIL